MSGPLLIEKDVQTTISFELELSGGPFNVSTIPDYTKVILLFSIIDTAPIQTAPTFSRYVEVFKKSLEFALSRRRVNIVFVFTNQNNGSCQL